MNPKLLLQAAKVLRNVGPKKMSGVALNKVLASTLLPASYETAPGVLAWTWARYPNVARWAIANKRAVWEHPKHGMDILLKLDKKILKLSNGNIDWINRYYNQMGRLAKFNTQMGPVSGKSRLDRADVFHDVMKNRDPIWRGLFGLASGNQAKTNPLYLGLNEAIKTKGITPVNFNPNNVRGKDLIAEAQFIARLGKQDKLSHNVMAKFRVKDKKFSDVWDFAENNPGKTREMQNEFLTNLIRNPEASFRSGKELGIRYARQALNARINPITIEGPVI